MLRRASVVLGVAVLLSLLFPMHALLARSGVEPLAVRVPGADLAALCVVVGLLPAMALCRDGRVHDRVPRWNAWLVLLAVFSVAFVLLHVGWTLDLATASLREALAPGGSVPLRISHLTLLDGAEFAVRLGVLVSVVGVLLNLQAGPAADAPAKRRRRA